MAGVVLAALSLVVVVADSEEKLVSMAVVGNEAMVVATPTIVQTGGPLDAVPSSGLAHVDWASMVQAITNYDETLRANNLRRRQDASTPRPDGIPSPTGLPASVETNAFTELVCSYEWDCAWALAVVACESMNSPTAYNPAGPYLGLFQIWEGYSANLYDPATNVAIAWGLYNEGGAVHWPNCP